MKKDPFGVFEVVIPAKDGQTAIEHNSKIKASIRAFRSVFTDLLDLHGYTVWRTN